MSAGKGIGAKGVLGLGAAACVACCIGPILAFFGGLTIVGLASTFVIGSVGLLVAAGAAMALLAVRHRRQTSACTTEPAAPVPVASPSRRP